MIASLRSNGTGGFYFGEAMLYCGYVDVNGELE